MVRYGALTAGHGWSEAYADDVVCTRLLKPLLAEDAAKGWMGAIETGIALSNALNAAVDEGLGVALHAFTAPDVVKDYCKVPDTWQPTWSRRRWTTGTSGGELLSHHQGG